MPPLERGGARVEVQQVVQGIGLPLEPEGVLPPYPGHHLQRGRLAGVGDHAVIVRGRGHDAVEQLQELIEAAHLDLTERRAVLVLPRLVKHPLGLLMQERILLHQRLQSGDRGHQRARLAGDRLTQPLYPARHMGLIPGDPATGMGMGVTRIHCLVHRSLLVEAPWARRMRCA